MKFSKRKDPKNNTAHLAAIIISTRTSDVQNVNCIILLLVSIIIAKVLKTLIIDVLPSHWHWADCHCVYTVKMEVIWLPARITSCFNNEVHRSYYKYHYRAWVAWQPKHQVIVQHTRKLDNTDITIFENFEFLKLVGYVCMYVYNHSQSIMQPYKQYIGSRWFIHCVLKNPIKRSMIFTITWHMAPHLNKHYITYHAPVRKPPPHLRMENVQTL